MRRPFVEKMIGTQAIVFIYIDEIHADILNNLLTAILIEILIQGNTFSFQIYNETSNMYINDVKVKSNKIQNSHLNENN